MRRSLTFLLLLGCMIAASPSWGSEPNPGSASGSLTIEDSLLTVTGTDGEIIRIALPCSPSTWVVQGQTLYGACADQGVLVVVLAAPDQPGSVVLYPTDGRVEDVFVLRDQVWVQLSRLEARPFTPGAQPQLAVIPMPAPGVSAPVQAPMQPAPPQSASGTVVGVSGAQVVIDLGSAAGLQRNDRVEIFVETTVDLGAGEVAQREELVAIGQVTTVTETRAQVALGMNERVPVGAFARPTSRPLTASRLAPARLGDIWEVRASLRPFLTLGTLGVGTISDVNVAYQLEAPVTVEAVIHPLGLGFAREANILAVGVNGVVSYDTTLFKVGLGLGWVSLREAASWEDERPSGGLSVAQTVRLGAADGLRLEAFNTFVLYDSQFHYSGTRGGIQVPTGLLTRRTWLVAQGGGSSSGEAFGEIGLRVLASGDGDHGTLLLTPTLGIGGLFGVRERDDCPPEYPELCQENVFFGGPMVGFGIEWRP
jgi:hypothetical protein